MPNPKQTLQAIKAAREAYKAKFTPGFYHGSPSNKIKAFDPNRKPSPHGSSSWDENNTPLGVTFISPSPKFAESFLPINAKTEYVNPPFKSGATMYPVSVNLGKHFDYENPTTHSLIEKYADNTILEDLLKKGDWASMENPAFLKLLREQGYDTFATHEGGVKNVGVFNPKNIRGKFAEYNPEHAESADFMKAEGGQINPIKTPREMMMEMAGMPPHMANGGDPKRKVASDVMSSAVRAVKEYRRRYGKNPSPQEMDELRRAVWESQQPRAPIVSDPQTMARANYLMANDPNYVASSPVTLGGTNITRNFNPDTSPDPFLYKSQFGRKPKGSWAPMEGIDINDPAVLGQIERAQAMGQGEAHLGESLTPSAAFFGDMARSLENQALRSGKNSVIDQLTKAFAEKNGRPPNFDELNAIVADYNVLRHQHGPMGASVVTKRPKSRTGMQEYVREARNEGIPEAYVTQNRPANYSDRLRAELQIAEGEIPARHVRSEVAESAPEASERSMRISYDEDGNPMVVQNFRDGSLALPANQMRADMAVAGFDPYENALEQRRLEKRAEAERMSRLAQREGKLSKAFRYSLPLFAPGSVEAASEAAKEGRPVEATLHGTNAAAALAAMKRKLMRPAVGVLGATAVPMSATDAYKRYQKGDTTGAIISGVETAGNAMQMLPFLPAQVAGTVLGMGAAGVNAYRDTE